MKQLASILGILGTALLLSVSASSASDLPACPPSGYFDNCFGSYTWDDGEKYVGEFKDDKYHGQGTYTFADGTKYVGEYKDGKKNGMFTVTYANGDKYVGEYKDDKKDGMFTVTYDNGDKYVGEYKDGKKNGQGTYTYANGDKYVGENKDGKKNGQGLYIFANGKADICSYTNDQNSNCFGTDIENVALNLLLKFKLLSDKKRKQIQIQLKKQEFYAGEINGEWSINTLYGLASYSALKLGSIEFQTHSEANRLLKDVLGKSESFASDLPACPPSGYFDNCFGSYTWDDGAKYVGEWKDDKRNGQGTITFAHGDKYVGEHKDGKYHGQGTYTYANGDKYVGEFKDDNFHGKGTFTYADGDKYVGEFKDDKKNGQGSYTYADGDKYVGEFKDDKKNGRGTYTFGPNSEWAGEKYVGGFKDGTKDGKGTYTYADGTKKEGIWKDDEFLYAKENTLEEPENNSTAENDNSNEILNAASGTGFYISSEGHIITNHHVINGCREVKVHVEGKSLSAAILAKDGSNDLALLKVSNNPPHVFALSNENPYPLQDIIVAGFPFGDAISSSLKFTKGIVSSLTGLGNNYSEIQIDAAIQPGNSGGPILDDFGNVVGVAVAKLDVEKVYEDYGVIPENTNFGIKGSVVKTLLQAHNVPLKAPNTEEISKSKLSQMTTKGTLHLSCWMTMAQIQKMQSQKAMFDMFD